jgi:hypothetical protein
LGSAGAALDDWANEGRAPAMQVTKAAASTKGRTRPETPDIDFLPLKNAVRSPLQHERTAGGRYGLVKKP